MPAILKRIERILDKEQRRVEKVFEKLGKEIFDNIRRRTPVWQSRDDDWEKLRRERGDTPGNAKRGWKRRRRKGTLKTQWTFFNMVPYIRVLEYGGFGDFKRFRIWGDYAGSETPRTKPATGEGQNSNVSKQAPMGMVRITLMEAKRKIKKEFGLK